MSDWRTKMLNATKTYKDAGVAGMAARRIWKGLGYRNVAKELGLKETELGIYRGGEEDDLTRVLAVWHWYLDRVESPVGQIVHHSTLTAVESGDDADTIARLSGIPNKQKTGKRVLYTNGEHMFLVVKVEDVLDMPRPMTIHGHRIAGFEVCQVKLDVFVRASIKRYEKVTDDL